MSGGANKSAKHTSWMNYSNKNCQVDGCKKRARRKVDGKLYCRRHCTTDKSGTSWIINKELSK